MVIGRNGSHKVVGICVSGVHNDNVKEMVMSISKYAAAGNYKTLLFNAFSDLFSDNADARGEGSVFDLVNPEILDALVIYPESIKNDGRIEQMIADMNKANVPVISIDRRIAGCYCLMFNYTDTFEDIVRHVVEDHACRRVNFIAGIKDNPFSDERMECYKKVLRENDIEIEEERIGYGDFWDLPTVRVMEDFFSSELPFPEAIVCANDLMAITACQVLRGRGYNVPDDVIVTGFDGMELEKYVSPRLTTAAPDCDFLGAAVVKIIDGIMAGDNVEKLWDVPYLMRYSESCGCQPVDAEQVGEKIVNVYRLMKHSYGHEVHMFSYLSKTIDCRSLEDMGKIMSSYSDYFSWCCVNSDFLSPQRDKDRYHGSFPSKMKVIMHCEDAHFVPCQPEFETHELLPDLGNVLESFPFLMFTPLHFQDEVMGYVVSAINVDNFVFENTRRFISNTSQIFENFKNRKSLERANAELAEMHIRDPLTGIFNRRGFYKNASKLIRRCDRSGDKLLVFSVDMDGLKIINDTYGHNEGDKAIKAVANALNRCFGETGVCSRFGGDEFVAIAPANGDTQVSPDRMSAAIDDCLREYNSRSRAPYKVMISCGTSVMDVCRTDKLDDHIKLADTDMYRKKREHHGTAF